MLRETPFKSTVFLALGTNIGNRRENLTRAREELEKQVTLVQSSSIYETSPWGLLDQPSFLNQVVEGRTRFDPYELLKFVKEIEIKMGRVTTERYGPRIIDIDILFFGDQALNTPNLVIPHPRMAERAFVLIPLAEIQPELIIPGNNLTVKELLEFVDISGILKIENHS
ncbi:MAG: 2-amino-4-hydroxy-6-hydroxymethyldihydropteridine diphosphokinase [Chloroflexi bacterium]|nr:MAG: 2-amino-4-hydroxy-6-hydroxymethyldihydropteridine diphosphokinase [Chloroflexota bacterium]